MYLFDLIRELNDSLREAVGDRFEGGSFPALTAVTDGYTVHIFFADCKIWDSETWAWEREVTNPSVSDILYEGERLRDYLMQRVSDYLLYLFRIDR